MDSDVKKFNVELVKDPCDGCYGNCGGCPFKN